MIVRTPNLLLYYTIMENQFDRQAIEALEVKTLESIEAITGPLEVNQELKALDWDKDLCTIIKTQTPEGKNVIEYVRRTHRDDTDGEDDGVVTFTVELD